MAERLVKHTATITLSLSNTTTVDQSPIDRMTRLARRFGVSIYVEELPRRRGQGRRYCITFDPIPEHHPLGYKIASLLNSLRGNGYLDHKDYKVEK